MPDPRSVMKEFRFLDQKRSTQGLSPDEEARFADLRDLVGAAPTTGAGRPGFDVNAAAARLRESLMPAGLRNRPPPPPEPSPEPEPEPLAEPAPLEEAVAAAWDAQPFQQLEAAPAEALFDPNTLADESAPPAAEAAAPAVYYYDPRSGAYYAPERVAFDEASGCFYDPTTSSWYEPDAVAWHEAGAAPAESATEQPVAAEVAPEPFAAEAAAPAEDALPADAGFEPAEASLETGAFDVAFNDEAAVPLPGPVDAGAFAGDGSEAFAGVGTEAFASGPLGVEAPAEPLEGEGGWAAEVEPLIASSEADASLAPSEADAGMELGGAFSAEAAWDAGAALAQGEEAYAAELSAPPLAEPSAGDLGSAGLEGVGLGAELDAAGEPPTPEGWDPATAWPAAQAEPGVEGAAPDAWAEPDPAAAGADPGDLAGAPLDFAAEADPSWQPTPGGTYDATAWDAAVEDAAAPAPGPFEAEPFAHQELAPPAVEAGETTDAQAWGAPEDGTALVPAFGAYDADAPLPPGGLEALLPFDPASHAAIEADALPAGFEPGAEGEGTPAYAELGAYDPDAPPAEAFAEGLEGAPQAEPGAAELGLGAEPFALSLSKGAPPADAPADTPADLASLLPASPPDAGWQPETAVDQGFQLESGGSFDAAADAAAPEWAGGSPSPSPWGGQLSQAPEPADWETQADASAAYESGDLAGADPYAAVPAAEGPAPELDFSAPDFSSGHPEEDAGWTPDQAAPVLEASAEPALGEPLPLELDTPPLDLGQPLAVEAVEVPEVTGSFDISLEDDSAESRAAAGAIPPLSFEEPQAELAPLSFEAPQADAAAFEAAPLDLAPLDLLATPEEPQAAAWEAPLPEADAHEAAPVDPAAAPVDFESEVYAAAEYAAASEPAALAPAYAPEALEAVEPFEEDMPTIEGEEILEELPPEEADAPALHLEAFEPPQAAAPAAPVWEPPPAAPAWQPPAAAAPTWEPPPATAQRAVTPPPAPVPPRPIPTELDDAGTWVAGTHRVVVHTVEGQVKRGLLENVDLAAAAIQLLPQPGGVGGSGVAEAIGCAEVKAIFFMLGQGESAPAPIGKRVRVTFRDGRQVAGFSPDYREGAIGFFMIPADARTSTGRIWVYQTAVRAVAVS